MSGQMIVYQPMWIGPLARPAIRLRRPWPGQIARIAAAIAGSTPVFGMAVGGLFGITTSYAPLWLAIGAGVGVAGGWVVSRSS